VIEPGATAWLLLGVGVLLAVSALFSRASGRFGVPVFLLFLAVGMLAGSEGLGGIEFEDYGLAYRIGTIALVLILFDGGLNTPAAALREGLRPAGVLATVGVVLTAALLGFGAWVLGFPPLLALLVGAVVSSTDAAAVFSTLRSSGVQLRRRVATVLELESGLNDPVAVILTTELTLALVRGRGLAIPALAFDLAVQLVVGALVGLATGHGWRLLLRRSELPAAGLYTVLTLGLAFVSYSLATVLAGSGFLAVYVAGATLGNDRFRYRTGVLRFHDAAAWCSQVSMFALLGLLAFPSRLIEAAWEGLVLGLFLVVLARPLAVLLCLLPFRLPWRERIYVAWVGLRGAVPIVLATFPVLNRVTGAERLFDTVFFIVVFSALLPGATVGALSRRLRVTAGTPPPPAAVLEIASLRPARGDVVSFVIHPAAAVAGVEIRDIPFPDESWALLVARGDELLPAKGETRLEAGDHVFVFAQPEDEDLLSLLFGSAHER
jgi:cell volume regulation protein A